MFFVLAAMDHMSFPLVGSMYMFPVIPYIHILYKHIRIIVEVITHANPGARLAETGTAPNSGTGRSHGEASRIGRSFFC